MLLSIVITVICSICVIFIGHHTWNYLKDNYSVRKTKYLVGSQIEKYKNIMQKMNANPNENISTASSLDDTSDMKADLENFLHSCTIPTE